MYDELFNRHRPSDLQPPPPGFYCNWLGLVTDLKFFPHRREWDGKVIAEIPRGREGDGIYGSDTEYASALIAVENRRDKDEFVGVELGAGWGPWIAAAGVAAKRAGVRRAHLVAVEADKGRCVAIKEHLDRNSLTEAQGVTSKILEGAAWPTDTVVRFGISDSIGDHGGAATGATEGRDYRGLHVPFQEVKAFSLKTICAGLTHIDYMHWDIQGSELDVAKASIEFLNKTTRYICIGTHSISLHGALIELFFANGWELVDHAVPAFIYDRSKPTLEAMGTKDGELLLANAMLIEGSRVTIHGREMKLVGGVATGNAARSERTEGLVVCGPYRHIDAGKYEVEVTYASDLSEGREAGWVDVTECVPGEAVTLAKKTVSGTRGKANSVKFNVEYRRDRLFEARAWSNGKGIFTIISVSYTPI